MKPKYKWLQLRNGSGQKIEGSWEDSIPEGWHKAFGREMVDELNRILEKYNYTNQYTITQIKEKYGMLRWYDCGIPKKAAKEYDKWLKKYENLSMVTCVYCGELATHMTKGWILPVCDGCGDN